jgi:hypothetical protein
MGECENASDSIRMKREFDSNEINDNDLQYEKHDKPRISISDGISTCDDFGKAQTNV